MPAREGIGHYLSRRLFPLAAGIGFLLAVSLPLTYWLLEHHNIQHVSDLYAEGLADDFQRFALDSPGLWKYQAYKFIAMTEGFHPIIDVNGFRVLDEKGEPIAGYEYKSVRKSPGAKLTFTEELLVTLGSAPILFNNRKVGTVEVLVSDSRILRTTGVIFCFSFLIGSTLAAMAYLFPVTVVKRAEEEILKLNKELELKVEERTKQLIDAQEELVRKEKLAALGQLSGSVGHELRNPLGVISNAAYFLQTVMPDADETVREYLGIIKSEVSHSQRIITDLLDFTKTRTPQAKLIAAAELIERSLEKCAIPTGVLLRVEMPDTLPPVKADALQLGQVFQNLITNAVQAMPNGGSLTIKAEEDKEAGALRITVADTGEGISPGNMKKLFQPLVTTKARGIGLGLVVSKKLTEANSGKLEVESEPGKGAAFSVILPVES